MSSTRLSFICAGDIWQAEHPLSPRMPSAPQNCSQQCTGAHATVCIREPADDTQLCLLFTAQDNTTDTQLSQWLAKISTWKSRSWPGLRLSRTEVRLAEGKAPRSVAVVRTRAHGLSAEPVFWKFSSSLLILSSLTATSVSSTFYHL